MINHFIALNTLDKKIFKKKQQIYFVNSQLEKYMSILRETPYIDSVSSRKVYYYKYKLYLYNLDLKRLQLELKRFL